MTPNTSEGEWARTWIGGATRDAITVAGRDLPAEIMGKLTLTELAYLLVTRRQPTPEQTRLLDAVLVSLADHGFTPSALAARLTYTGAPEAIQGAIAAGLLGAGSVFLGPAGDTAQFLFDALQADGASADADDARLTRIAEAAVDARRAGGERVPGLGHPVHKDVDPRTPRLYAIAEENGLLGPHLRLLEKVAEVNELRSGKHLPVNGAGAGGAALVDLGLPPSSARGVVLIARTAGLVAHLVEEAAQPGGRPLWLEVERRASDPS
jgi:citrate synthase